MTKKDFCKSYTAYHGEPLSDIRQLVQQKFTGEELFEFVEFIVQDKDKEIIGFIQWVANEGYSPYFKGEKWTQGNEYKSTQELLTIYRQSKQTIKNKQDENNWNHNRGNGRSHS